MRLNTRLLQPTRNPSNQSLLQPHIPIIVQARVLPRQEHETEDILEGLPVARPIPDTIHARRTASSREVALVLDDSDSVESQEHICRINCNIS